MPRVPFSGINPHCQLVPVPRRGTGKGRTVGAKGICPTDWHIPTLAEFQTLAATVGNDGKALKEIGQGNGTNLSGFSALLSGGHSITLNFIDLEYIGYFWSSTPHNELWANYMHLYSNTEVVHFSSDIKEDAMSVRCIKD